MVFLHIIPSRATGQSHWAHSESGECIIYTLGMLFTDPMYAMSSFMQIKTFVFDIVDAHMMAKHTISS